MQVQEDNKQVNAVSTFEKEKYKQIAERIRATLGRRNERLSAVCKTEGISYWGLNRFLYLGENRCQLSHLLQLCRAIGLDISVKEKEDGSGQGSSS